MTFQQTVQHFAVPQSHFFRYLQVRDYLRKNFSFPAGSDCGWIECLDYDPFGRALVSRLYDALQLMSAPSLNHIKEQWEEEMGREILEVNW